MTITIPVTRGLCAVIDDADFDLVGSFKWHTLMQPTNTYAVRNVKLQDGRWGTERMHVVLTGWPETDHANGDGLDNRRANLRRATRSQNSLNGSSRGGSSPFKGVSLKEGRWRARIKVNYREIYLGRFSTPEEAAKAYDDAARDLAGEFAALNFPRPGERCALTETPAGLEGWR